MSTLDPLWQKFLDPGAYADQYLDLIAHWTRQHERLLEAFAHVR